MKALKLGKMERRRRAVRVPADPAPLDRWRADQVLEPRRQLWGLAKIAAYLGLSVDTVRGLAEDPAVPIYRPAGRYFAWSDELGTWLRSK